MKDTGSCLSGETNMSHRDRLRHIRELNLTLDGCDLELRRDQLLSWTLEDGEDGGQFVVLALRLKAGNSHMDFQSISVGLNLNIWTSIQIRVRVHTSSQGQWSKVTQCIC
ncbi:hypothetical protein ABVT39_009430 [Epinephelus coioides]